MSRYSDWQSRLLAYLGSVHQTPFEYGNMDCVLFVSGAVQAMSGAGFAEGGKGQYDTLIGGLRKLREAGYEDHFGAIKDLYPQVHPAFANVGDIAVVKNGNEKGLGIVQGEMIYVMTEHGFGVVPRSMMEEAYSV